MLKNYFQVAWRNLWKNRTFTILNLGGLMISTAAICISSVSYTQKKQSFDLQQLLKENKFINFSKTLSSLDDGEKHGVSCSGIVWLKDVHFTKGTIEINLRGKDVIQQSFLGIAFHGVDTTTYDLVYFRPFNFRSTDSVRKIHAVQYVSAPDYPWERLREQHNGVYEKGINPPPLATDWLHARIVVDESEIKVYVNGATTPSLTVKKLNSRTDGMIGLWDEFLPGDFANLVISQ
jgi:hypothetical protein